MRLLILTNNPGRASFRQRIEAYLPLLEAEGVACRVERLPDNIISEMWLLRSARQFDGVLLHKKGLNALEALVLGRYAGRVIYDFDDAIMYKQGEPDSSSRGRMARFARSVRAADLVLAGNEYLAAHAKRYGEAVVVLPTGLDRAAQNIPSARTGDGRIRLGWIGSEATLPYLQAIVPALDRCAGRNPSLVLRVISDKFPDVTAIKMEKCVWSDKTQYAELAACDIGIAPLPDDKFTRGKCGFKILQYQSAGLPVICSPVGVNAELVQHGVSGFHAGREDEWVAAIERLASDSSLRDRMGKVGLQSSAAFDRAVIGKRFAGLVAGCLRGGA